MRDASVNVHVRVRALHALCGCARARRVCRLYVVWVLR